MDCVGKGVQINIAFHIGAVYEVLFQIFSAGFCEGNGSGHMDAAVGGYGDSAAIRLIRQRFAVVSLAGQQILQNLRVNRFHLAVAVEVGRRSVRLGEELCAGDVLQNGQGVVFIYLAVAV